MKQPFQKSRQKDAIDVSMVGGTGGGKKCSREKMRGNSLMYQRNQGFRNVGGGQADRRELKKQIRQKGATFLRKKGNVLFANRKDATLVREKENTRGAWG